MSVLQITSLRRQRGNIKRQLSNFESLLNSIDENTDYAVLDLELRLKKHEALWDTFDSIQSQLENLQIDDSEAQTEHDTERTSFENRFYMISGTTKKHLQKLSNQSAIASTDSTSLSNISNTLSIQNSHLAASSNSNVLQTQILEPSGSETNSGSGATQEILIPEQVPIQFSSHFELPKLSTPIFHGTFDTWLSFYDSFRSMCHDNPKIPVINKFMYLRACLKDEAAEVIASLETTSENYLVAWELLKNRYDNRKFIVESHIKALFEIPTISKEFSIRSLLDHVQKRVRALRALDQPVEHWDTLLVFMIREKLNNYTREKWEESVGSTQIPTLKDMFSFLERRSLIENTQIAQRQTSLQKTTTKNGINSRSNQRSTSTCLTTNSKPDNQQVDCPLCSKVHMLYACDKFLGMPEQERYDFVKKKSLCHNCLSNSHRTLDCRKGPCRKCKKRHNTLLHFTRKNQETENDSLPSTSASLVSVHAQSPSQVVLGTAIIEIQNSKGRFIPCRALLDSCSQCNSITEKLASRLGLCRTKIDLKLQGVENLQTSIKHMTSAKVKSRINETTFDMSFLIFQEISGQMPSIVLDRNLFQIPHNIVLADPEFHRPADIDILIGAEYYYELLRAGKIRMPNQTALLQETDFGWIIAGRYSKPLSFKNNIACNLIKFQDLSILWEIETDNNVKLRSKEEQACEVHYANNITRDDTGRYIAKLPFNEKKESLGDSRNSAFQRFYALERKFEKNPLLKSQYTECIQGYLDEGHMTLLSNREISSEGFYLPHHAVIKESSLTTKVRVVFDGSAKSSTGISLNDTLMVGPTIQEDLFSIVTRFRSFLYALSADIQQMYRQIQIAAEDTKFQKILWRTNPSEPIKIYCLNRVTFGTACAPFLAIRTLFQLADDEGDSHPIAANILKRDLYVDDLMSGAQSYEDARYLRDDLIKLSRKGGFILRKWVSNHPQLGSEFSPEDSNVHMSLDPSETVKTLGLYWDPKSDSILYTVNLSKNSKQITKRSILSEISKLFDPLGLLGPVIVTAKILIQQLWKSKLTWDTPLPLETQTAWLDYKEQLPLLNNIKFNRCIVVPNFTELQLHGFCDASEKAYGACLYLRSTNEQGKHHCALICSKSRVAPIKTISLPRLELCAAHLLSKLYSSTAQALHMQFSEVYFWSDSTIVLNWINTPPHTLKTFEANRVAEIQEKTQAHKWRHVPTHDNPADLLSRGQKAQDFVNNKFWSHGPSWLSNDVNTWPRLNEPISSLKVTQCGNYVLQRFSTIQRLQSVVAYCFRFFNNIKTKDETTRLKGTITPAEINTALHVIIKVIQTEMFAKEIRALSLNQNVHSESSLFRLNPFLDQGIIRVGGRLTHANIPYSQKHPIVLPKGHYITSLIIREEHIKRFHAGVQATLYGLRERYWPIDGRNATRHIIRQCVKCFRVKPRETNYQMGNLPKNRLTFTRPFINVGVDYCGPFFIKERRHRNRSKVKTYVSIFVCLATKAIHLELASDLTTEAFIACMTRFFSRRGLAESVSSDNATNFVGANNEIKELYHHIKSLEENEGFQGYLTTKGITWHFIPPRAPHFGGLWEASVKSFKNHFTRVAGNSLLTYEQLHTYVVEIEAILNSRPLTPLSSDPNDLLPLTPGHFLIGNSMTSFPTTDLRMTPVNRLSCWQLAQQMRQHFWDRWHREYLNEMISRNKWQAATDQSAIKIGTLVVMKEDNIAPMTWKLGRIIDKHPGQDGVIRTITLQTAFGIYKRSLKQVYPLPIDIE